MNCPTCGRVMMNGYIYADVLRGIRFKLGTAKSTKAEILYGSGVDAYRCEVCGIALVPNCPLR